jgi:pSer/pThr/pTyr-binding forkhead associated (FHA) protein
MAEKNASKLEEPVERNDVSVRSGLRSLQLVLQGSSYVIELTRPEMVLGRHSRCDIRLPLPDVSRRHCRFVHSDGAWSVGDLQSTNGIYVNGARVAEAVLQEHDRLGIGGFKFEVRFGDPVSESAAAATSQGPGPGHDLLSLPKPTGNEEPERRKAS